jgi:hypothetical protein
MDCKFGTPTLGLRSQNLHRSGATSASPFWGVIPKNRIGANLMNHLHTQSIKEIKVYTLSYVGANPSPDVVETITFESCFIIYVSPWAQGCFTCFAFSFVKYTWDIVDYDQKDSSSGISNKVGNRSYTFEFDKASGTLA